MHNARNVKAFTLIEIIVVLIIIGIMASLTLPRMIGPSIEQAAFSEAVHHLSAYVTAEQSYFLDHDQYAPTCNDLEIDVTFKGFNALSCQPDGLVSVTRNSGGYGDIYTVRVNVADNPPSYTCTIETGDCPSYLMKLLPQ